MSNKLEDLHTFLSMYKEWDDQIKKCLLTKEVFFKEDMMEPRMLRSFEELPEQSEIAIRQHPAYLIENFEDSLKKYKTGVILCYNKSKPGGKDNSCESLIRSVSGYHNILGMCEKEMAENKDDGFVLMFDEVPYIGRNFTVDDIKAGLPSFTLALCDAEVDTTDSMFETEHKEWFHTRFGKLSFAAFNLLQRGCRSIVIVTDEFNNTESECDLKSRETLINDIACCTYSIMQIVFRFEIYIGGYNVNVVGDMFQKTWQQMGNGGE